MTLCSVKVSLSPSPSPSLSLPNSATNAENMEMNKVKNHLTGEYGAVPDTGRYYKVLYNITRYL